LPVNPLPMTVIWAFIPSDGIAFITHWFIKKAVDIFVELPFSREMETEADTFGLEVTAKACYDVRGAPAIWMVKDLLDEAGAILINCTKEEDDANILEEYKTLEAYLSTHLGHDDRYKQLQNIMEATLAIRKECGCPELYQDSDPCMGASQARKWWESQCMTICGCSLPQIVC
jgi:Zn-dependent protease with chaperone function